IEKKQCCGSQGTGRTSKIPITIKERKECRYDQADGKFREKMTYLSGGTFIMGTDDQKGFPDDQEGPARTEEVAPFYFDTYGVTNEEFQQFVQETGYVTESEKYGWSFVFHTLLTKETMNT